MAGIWVASNFITSASAATESIIVQLKSDPVMVAKARAEATGQDFDPAAYRQSIIAEYAYLLVACVLPVFFPFASLSTSPG